MGAKRPARLPPGRQPYDPANGLRVGGFAGALAAGAVSVALGFPTLWVVPAGAVIGAVTGYMTERRKLRGS